MTLYRLVLQKALPGTETVWTVLASHKFESDVEPEQFQEAVDKLASEAQTEHEPAHGRN